MKTLMLSEGYWWSDEAISDNNISVDCLILNHFQAEQYLAKLALGFYLDVEGGTVK